MTNKKRAISINLSWIVLILVALKIFGIINWDWIWIFSPLWFLLALFVLIIFIGLMLPIAVYIITQLFVSKK